jgi:chloramphenicol 3-O-phosphotransferase
MRLVFLHGPAAVGKYTVAQALAGLTGFELYHNHLVVDEVLQQHPFGTPGFVAERDRRWREFFGRFPGPGRENLIFTFNPENTVPQLFIDWLFAGMARRGVPLHSVGLTAGEAVIESRIASSQRRQFGKLTDLALYRQLRDSGAFATPVIPRTDLLVDTGTVPPDDAARRIADRLQLS